MSLINDALKRAKLEALEREAQNKADYGLPTPRRRRSRPGVRLPWWIAGMLLLALVGVGIGWILARVGGVPDHRPATAAAPSTVLMEAELTSTDSQSGGGATDEVTPAVAEPDTPAGATSSETQVAPASNSEPAADDEYRAEAAAVDARTPGPEAETGIGEPRTSPGTSGGETAAGGISELSDGATHVRVLEVGSERLELQGIAFRDGGSVAIINDLMVAADDMVGGFRVVAIEPERVQLQGRGVTLYLSLH